MNDPETLVGHRVNQYEIREHLASGGMADVYLAHDVTLNRLAALKILLPALAADGQFVARFQREAQTVARLEHPNIIQIYGIGETASRRPYLAMQYIDGGSLQDVLETLATRGERLETTRALQVVATMAEALQVAHAADIVHRDMKPSNILIRKDGTPVLVDLGIAAVGGGPKLTHTGTLIGTPYYMSPEQVGSGKTLDGRADIYALGVILYEMLAGRKPFMANDSLAVLHMHAYEPPPPLPPLNPHLRPETVQIVDICLQKDPAARFQTAAELQQAARVALKAEGGEAALSDSSIWRPSRDSRYYFQGAGDAGTPSLLPAQPAPPAAGSKRPFWLWLLFFLGIGGVLAVVYFVWGDGFSAGQQMVTLATAMPTPTTAAATGTVSLAPSATFAPLATFTPSPAPSPTNTAVAPTQTPTPDVGPETIRLGESVLGTPIEAVRFGAGERPVILIGGLHAGFAPGTVSLAQRAITHFSSNPAEVPAEVTLFIVANASPDTADAPGELDGRLNANGVDINRNWGCRWVENAQWRGAVVPGSGGPRPFSEPETEALHQFFLAQQPAAVVFWEGRASNGLSAPGICEVEQTVSVRLAQVYGVAADYQVADFEDLTDQELNGDVTNWLDSQDIPAVAILLPTYEDPDWPNNLAGIQAVLAYTARGSE